MKSEEEERAEDWQRRGERGKGVRRDEIIVILWKSPLEKEEDAKEKGKSIE